VAEQRRHAAWFEGLGASRRRMHELDRPSLHAVGSYVGDATSRLVHLHFTQTESAFS
jgi:hypothetical protein